MKLFWTLALALAVAACTPMQWVKEDADPMQAEADSRACQTAAWQEARWRSFMYQGMYAHAFYRDALGRPYYAVPRPYDAFGDPFMEEQRLLDFCMRAKGYELQPVN